MVQEARDGRVLRVYVVSDDCARAADIGTRLRSSARLRAPHGGPGTTKSLG